MLTAPPPVEADAWFLGAKATDFDPRFPKAVPSGANSETNGNAEDSYIGDSYSEATSALDDDRSSICGSSAVVEVGSSQKGYTKEPSHKGLDVARVHLENQRLREEIDKMCQTIKQQSNTLSQLWTETNLLQESEFSSCNGVSDVLKASSKYNGGSMMQGFKRARRVENQAAGTTASLSVGHSASSYSSTAPVPKDGAAEAEPWTPGSWICRSAKLRAGPAKVPDAASTTPKGLARVLGMYPSDSRLPLFSPALGPRPQPRQYVGGKNCGAFGSTATQLTSTSSAAVSCEADRQPHVEGEGAVAAPSPSRVPLWSEQRSVSVPFTSSAQNLSNSATSLDATSTVSAPCTEFSQMKLKIDGIDYDQLVSNTSLAKSVKMEIKRAVIEEAGNQIKESSVHVDLSKGSVVATIKFFEPVTDKLKTSSTLTHAVAAQVDGVPGINAVKFGPIVVCKEDIEDCAVPLPRALMRGGVSSPAVSDLAREGTPSCPSARGVSPQSGRCAADSSGGKRRIGTSAQKGGSSSFVSPSSAGRGGKQATPLMRGSGGRDVSRERQQFTSPGSDSALPPALCEDRLMLLHDGLCEYASTTAAEELPSTLIIWDTSEGDAGEAFLRRSTSPPLEKKRRNLSNSPTRESLLAASSSRARQHHRSSHRESVVVQPNSRLRRGSGAGAAKHDPRAAHAAVAKRQSMAEITAQMEGPSEINSDEELNFDASDTPQVSRQLNKIIAHDTRKTSAVHSASHRVSEQKRDQLESERKPAINFGRKPSADKADVIEHPAVASASRAEKSLNPAHQASEDVARIDVKEEKKEALSAESAFETVEERRDKTAPEPNSSSMTALAASSATLYSPVQAVAEASITSQSPRSASSDSSDDTSVTPSSPAVDTITVHKTLSRDESQIASQEQRKPDVQTEELLGSSAASSREDKGSDKNTKAVPKLEIQSLKQEETAISSDKKATHVSSNDDRNKNLADSEDDDDFDEDAESAEDEEEEDAEDEEEEEEEMEYEESEEEEEEEEEEGVASSVSGVAAARR